MATATDAASRRAQRLRDLTPRDLARVQSLIADPGTEESDRWRLRALVVGIQRDLGPDLSAAPLFGPAWLRSTAPAWWTWNWTHQLRLYKALNEVRQGTIKKLIIVWPPRHTKTETATVRFPLYWLSTTPTQHVIVAGHTQTYANRISRKIRRLARGRIAISEERKASNEWETLDGGGLRAVGVGVATAGHGGDLIFIDDPIRKRADAESQTKRDALWEWYTDDIYPRLEPGGALIIVTTRWHENDLVGRILASDDAKEWTVLHFRALATENDPLDRKPGEALCPDRYPRDVLLKIREIEGSYSFGAMYQGEPTPPEGGIFKRAGWRYWAPAELVSRLPPVRVKMLDGSYIERRAVALPRAPERMPFVAFSADCTFKDAESNDFVAIGVWAKLAASYYLLDQIKAHLDFPATLRELRALARRYPYATAKWVEDKANGSAVIQTLRAEIDGIIAVEPEGGKIARAHATAPLVEAGNVYLPHPALVAAGDGGNWVDELVESCASFPNATHDDDVDQLTQALLKLRRINTLDETFATVRAHA